MMAGFAEVRCRPLHIGDCSSFGVAAALPPGSIASEVRKATLLLFANNVNTAGAIDVDAAASARNEWPMTFAVT